LTAGDAPVLYVGISSQSFLLGFFDSNDHTVFVLCILFPSEAVAAKTRLLRWRLWLSLVT